VGLYTLGGLATAVAVGSGLGVFGMWIMPDSSADFVTAVLAVLGVVLAAREVRWLKFSLPERKRQTEKIWVEWFGAPMGTTLWGAHIGLGFATRITYGGFWIVVAMAIACSTPTGGALLMGIYWAGRALPVWFAALVRNDEATSIICAAPGAADHVSYQRLCAATLLVLATLLLASRALLPRA
jgi:hypothetical protein